MSLKLYNAIYFDSRGMDTSSQDAPSYLPIDRYGNQSDIYDWINSTVNGIGNQSVSLFCQARTRRKIEDFYEYFSRNEIVWYKFILSRDTRILKILRVYTYDLEGAVFTITDEPFPSFEYKFKAFVSDVERTDDDRYETDNSFYINYRYNSYVQPSQGPQ